MVAYHKHPRLDHPPPRHSPVRLVCQLGAYRFLFDRPVFRVWDKDGSAVGLKCGDRLGCLRMALFRALEQEDRADDIERKPRPKTVISMTDQARSMLLSGNLRGPFNAI